MADEVDRLAFRVELLIEHSRLTLDKVQSDRDIRNAREAAHEGGFK